MPWRRVLKYVAGAGIAAAVLGYAFWPQPVPVDLTTAVRGEMLETIDSEGQTRVREVFVVSAPVSGRVLRIEQHVGDPVRANDTVMAKIEPSAPTFLDQRALMQAQAAVKAAEAALALAEAEQARAAAELNFAKSELNRAEQLARRETISERELDRARLDARTSEAALATAEATVTMRRFDLETARAALIQPGANGSQENAVRCCVDVLSPVDGQVLRLIHESEGTVSAGQPLIEVGDPADLEIVVDLLSTDAVRVSLGDEVAIADWGGPRILSGRVRRVEPYGFTKVSALGIEEQRVNVLVDLTDPYERWRSLGHGFRVEAKIAVWKGKDVLKLPLGALFREGDDWAVFVVEDDRARLRRVRIGHTNGREAEILDGLAPGEHVILHPGDQIADGVRVVQR